jgi:2-C-methyl-D-erythritol 4-phosphate cytidylyltransferase
MRADRPKQFLELCGKTVSERSLSLFLGMPEITQIVIVVEKRYREAYFGRYVLRDKRIVFADPGLERQDSVRSGLALVPDTADRLRDEADDILVCVHDAARPLVSRACIRSCLRDASIYGAAVIGVPCKATIKESEDGQFVRRTIERSRLWEIQTPQVIRARLLRHGFEHAQRKGLRVTDDVSVVELLEDEHHPVKITMGDYANIKLTTPEDMILAEMILRERSKMNGVALDGTHPECEDI